MPKMHELIAVVEDLKSQATTVRTELMSTFGKKSHLFGKKIVTTTFLAEGVAAATDIQSDIQTTLSKEILSVSRHMAKSMDAGLQIDMGNLQAKADLIISEDGIDKILMKNVPATYLLQLEKQVAHMRELAVTIPTLDPALGFEPDSDAGKGIWKAREVVKEKTKKVKKILTAAPATDKHPAQVQVYDADEVVGQIREQQWSALTTPAVKSEILANIDILQRAVKQARSRANSTEINVDQMKLGAELLKFVFKPLE